MLNLAVKRYLLANVQERTIIEVHTDRVAAVGRLVLEVEAHDGFTRQQRTAVPARIDSCRAKRQWVPRFLPR